MDKPSKVKSELLAMVMGNKMEWLRLVLPLAMVKTSQKFPPELNPGLLEGLALFLFLMQREVLNDDATLLEHFNV